MIKAILTLLCMCLVLSEVEGKARYTAPVHKTSYTHKTSYKPSYKASYKASYKPSSTTVHHVVHHVVTPAHHHSTVHVYRPHHHTTTVHVKGKSGSFLAWCLLCCLIIPCVMIKVFCCPNTHHVEEKEPHDDHFVRSDRSHSSGSKHSLMDSWKAGSGGD